MSRHGPAGLHHDEEALGKAYDARIVRRLWGYVRPYKGLVALALGLLFAGSAAQLVQPYLIKLAIDTAIREGALGRLAPLAGLFFGALVLEFLLRFGQIYVLERLGQNVVFDLRMTVFGHLQRLPSAFFDKNPVGRLMTRVTSDVESLNEAFTSGLVLILADLVTLSGIVVILFWMDWRMALVTLAILPAMLAVTWYFRTRMRRSYRAVRAMVARLNAFLQESVTGVKLIQLFVRERANQEEFEQVNRKHRDAELAAVKYDSTFSAVAELMASLTLAAIIWAGGWRILGAAITFGTLVAFIEYAGKFFRPVQELSQRYAVMQAAMASSERIFSLLDTTPAIRSPERPHRLSSRARGEIVFENVTFGYDPDDPVLRDVSFRVGEGQRVAVVGWTGSGKSTLIRLLVRLYDVQQGRILLDGVDVREYDLSDLRRSVGVVLQDHFLFAGTVQDNIGLGDPRIGPPEIRAAAEAVQADRFIERLQGGYGEEVRERGSNFSVGEKQLLSFARAIAFDPAVLVLDEATASVDASTERAIQEALDTVLRGRTSVVIAHRLATIQNADRILVLHHGEVREQGSHEELVQVPEGIYRTLYNLQSAPGGGHDAVARPVPPDPEALKARFADARCDSGLAVLEGFHALKHALRFGAAVEIAVSDDPGGASDLAHELAPDIAGRLAGMLVEVSADTFAALATPAPRTAVMAIARRASVDPASLLALPDPAPVVFLDRPAHLGNVGAVVRVAAAAGAAGVIASGPHDPWHPSALRGAAGLHFAVPVARVAVLPDSDRALVAMDPGGEPLGPGSIPDRAVLAFGSEREGLGPALLERATHRLAIPMTPGVSSLNLATAVAVTLYTPRGERRT